MIRPDAGILVFDGMCPFCSRVALWVVRHDRHDRFRLAASQSAAGRRILAEKAPALDPDVSIVLIENGKAYVQSTAALRLLRRLDGLLPLLYVLIIVPRFIRDAAYRYVAGRRTRWFGKRDSCFIPDDESKSKFL